MTRLVAWVGIYEFSVRGPVGGPRRCAFYARIANTERYYPEISFGAVSYFKLGGAIRGIATAWTPFSSIPSISPMSMLNT